MAQYFDPHILVYIKAMSIEAEGRTPTLQELRGEIDLGLYTMDEMADLRKTVLLAIEEWVANHPPHEG